MNMESIANLLNVPLVTIGGTQTTIGTWLAAIITVIVTLLAAKLVRRGVQKFFQRLDKADDFGNLGGIAAQLTVWLIGFEIALHLLGIQLTTLLAASGFLALGAGFAVKNIVENFLSGGILKAENTIRPGDLIVINDKWMYIQRIGLRTVRAKTYDGEDILIPNSLVAQSMVQNLTRDNREHRIEIEVQVAYDSDLKLVRTTLEQALESLEWRSQDHPPHVYLSEFGESSVNYNLIVWIEDANDSRGRKSDLHEVIWWALKDADITIAYPQMHVHIDRKTVA
jgi:small-conductance mechanosensitive channel